MITEFQQALANRYRIMEEQKERGKRVVGWLCLYVPEEILHAAGAFPVRIMGGARETPTANSYLYSTNCSFVRNCLEQGLGGHYRALDGLVAFNTCDHIRRLFDVWKRYLGTPYAQILSLPYKLTPASLAYYQGELVRLKEGLEKAWGIQITDPALRESIGLYNRTRRLLQQLYALRQSDAPPISGTEILQVVLAGMVMDREQYNRQLEALLGRLEGRGGEHRGKIRLLLMGSEMEDPGYVQLIEELGGIVVTDDLCNGTRYFEELVDPTGDPLEALARRYLNKAPCPRLRPSSQRVERLQQIARDWRVQGVIYESIKFCDLHSGVFPVIRDGFQEMGLPVLSLQREYTMASAGQMKTRVQAFYENLGGEDL
ncbi:MAG: 2-hydroxyacyl-CoA dehydratase [Candidatus Tectomicrobia bacterium]|uniref:2-hydroxyacyl-CoA dehydratase n=1 Tax=Tectimicrobiota bacterium TaxID=2528274 RepID=A0A932CRR9_UNCTE|nr:2-hydroxyacyl-CoA dehydratase [Candidatus Tectomicrobia bacterium]